MEFCNGGSLENFVRVVGGHLEEPDAQFFLRQIVNAYKVNAEKGVMHWDLKLSNVCLHFSNLSIEERFRYIDKIDTENEQGEEIKLDNEEKSEINTRKRSSLDEYILTWKKSKDYS